jgi:hypothetical protein
MPNKPNGINKRTIARSKINTKPILLKPIKEISKLKQSKQLFDVRIQLTEQRVLSKLAKADSINLRDKLNFGSRVLEFNLTNAQKSRIPLGTQAELIRIGANLKYIITDRIVVLSKGPSEELVKLEDFLKYKDIKSIIEQLLNFDKDLGKQAIDYVKNRLKTVYGRQF